MSDLVERLRAVVRLLRETEDCTYHQDDTLATEAAARIEQLEAALRELVGAVADPTSQQSLPLALRAARAALEERT